MIKPLNATQLNNRLLLHNQHLVLEVDPSTGNLILLQGRFATEGDFSPNLLARNGLSWQVQQPPQPQSYGIPQGRVAVEVLEHSTHTLYWQTHWFTDQQPDPVATADWSLSLGANPRAAQVKTSLTLHRPWKLKTLALELPTKQWFLAGLFERGVVQQVCAGEAWFASSNPLEVFYSIGHNQGAVAVVPQQPSPQTLLGVSASREQTSVNFMLLGGLAQTDQWLQPDWNQPPEVELPQGSRFEYGFDLYANDLPFPTHTLHTVQLPTPEDLRTQLTSIYAVQVGCLGSYALAGSAYPTIAMPTRHYRGMHTFFDPDAWSVVNALSYSGDPYLQSQAKAILERACSGMNSRGQIPHHFDGEQAVYVAISGAAQTGPNLFWCLAALDYVCATGDVPWLQQRWVAGVLRAAAWVLDHYDPQRQLLKANGPLWIDVFKHEGYTFDTNAFAVHVFRKVAAAARFLGNEAVGQRFLQASQDLCQGLEALWDGHDHYITARTADWSSTLDKVDSDNFAAVAFGISGDPERLTRILERLDGNPQTHPGGRGTWVSERYYNVDDCYLGNVGDSECAMARLFWLDLRAHHAVGDRSTFDHLFENVRRDFFNLTWMTERYGAAGQMIRAPGYHEYPGVLTMLMREARYGLDIDLEQVTLKPLTPNPFELRLGALWLRHSDTEVALCLPGQGQRLYTIHNLQPNRPYRLNHQQTFITDSAGVLRFNASVGTAQSLTLEERL